MSSRTRKRFLVAVKNQPGWFQAVREGTAKTNPDAVHVPKLGSKLRNLNAPSYEAELLTMLKKTPGVKEELAVAIAQGIVEAPQKLQELVAEARENELWERKLNVDLDVQEQLFIQLTAELGSEDLAMDELNRREDDLAYMREQPDSSYRPNRALDRVLRLCAAAEILNVMTSTPELATAKELAEFLQQLPDKDLIDLSCKLNPVRIDHYTRDSLMAHWQDAGRRDDGTSYDGFTIQGQYFVRGDVAEKLIREIPPHLKAPAP